MSPILPQSLASHTPPTLAPNDRITLNVGGVKHSVQWKLLSSHPHTRLGKLYDTPLSDTDSILRLCDDMTYSHNRRKTAKIEFYFDHNPKSFPSILNLYRTGELHLLDDMCVFAFGRDLDYWEVGENYFEYCCQEKYWLSKERVTDDMKKDLNFSRHQRTHSYSQVDFGGGECGLWKRRIWIIFDQPKSSALAYIIGLISIASILISTIALVVNSLPEIQSAGCSLENQDDLYCDVNENSYTYIVDAICIGWFTIEYFTRLATTHQKLGFLRSPLNIIDLLSILPFYLTLFLSLFNIAASDFKGIFDILRLVKILRVFKLARHSLALQSLFVTFRNAYKELGVLFLFLSMGMIIFSCLAYFAERSLNKDFDSIPATFWWAIITMTTVGYGDMTPITGWGKLIGAACGISGVLVIALPIPFIVDQFAEYYRDQVRRGKMTKLRTKLVTITRNESVGSELLFKQFRLADLSLSGDDIDKNKNAVHDML